MSAIRYIERLKLMDFYIRSRSTGSPVEFAAKISISERSLYEYLNILKELGAPVAFSYYENSYIYYEEGRLQISFSCNDPSLSHQTKGQGSHYQSHIYHLEVYEDLTQLRGYCSISNYF